MKTFGENLKTIRKQHAMNQHALGEAIGVGQTTIANYEKGLRFPTGDLLKRIAEILNVSIDELMGHHVLPDSPIERTADMEAFKQRFVEALITQNEQEAIVMIWSLKPNRDNLLFIYEEILMHAMINIGSRWEKGELTVAVEHYASHVVHKIIAMLSTIPAEAPKSGKKAICMSLSSEPHTIGVKMISEFLNLKGVQTYYIGTSVPTDSLVDMLKKQKADLLAVSATMDYHLNALKNLIEVIRSNKYLKDLKIVVGGQAFRISSDTPESMGADGYAASFDQLGKWLEDNSFSVPESKTA